MTFRRVCTCCGPKLGICQKLYNPRNSDCPWSIKIEGSHTPSGQRDLPIAGIFQRPIRLGASMGPRQSTASLFYGVRDHLDTDWDTYHLIPHVLPTLSADMALEIPLDFGGSAANPCTKTASKTASEFSGLLDVGFGTPPPETYSITYDNVALYQRPLRADTVTTYSVGSGPDGLGPPATAQVFSSSVAGLSGDDLRAGNATWVRDYGQHIGFDAQTFAGGDSVSGYLAVFALGGLGVRFYDTTTLEWSHRLDYQVDAEFRDGVVDVEWAGASNSTARAVLRPYGDTSWVLESGTQGVYTGRFGTTDVSLPNSIGTNTFLGAVGTDSSGSQTLGMYRHPLLTALGVPLTGPRNVRFWVRWLYRPSIEGAYTFDSLDGEPEPDGWTGPQYATPYGSTAIDLVCTLTRNAMKDPRVIPPRAINDAGSQPVTHQGVSWSGQEQDGAKWRGREGFSLDLTSGDSSDVLTATRNDGTTPCLPQLTLSISNAQYLIDIGVDRVQLDLTVTNNTPDSIPEGATIQTTPSTTANDFGPIPANGSLTQSINWSPPQSEKDSRIFNLQVQAFTNGSGSDVTDFVIDLS